MAVLCQQSHLPGPEVRHLISLWSILGTTRPILKTINKIKSTNLDKLCFGSGLCGSIFALSVGCMTYLHCPYSISKVSQERGEEVGAENLLLIILCLLHPFLNCFLRASGSVVAALSYNIPTPARSLTLLPVSLFEENLKFPPPPCLEEKQFFHRFSAWRPDDNAKPWNLSMNISAHFLNKSQCFTLGDSSAVYWENRIIF